MKRLDLLQFQILREIVNRPGRSVNQIEALSYVKTALRSKSINELWLAGTILGMEQRGYIKVDRTVKPWLLTAVDGALDQYQHDLEMVQNV